MTKNKHYVVEIAFVSKSGEIVVRRAAFTNKRVAIATASDMFNETLGFKGGVTEIDTTADNRGWVVLPTVTRYEYDRPVAEFVINGRDVPVWRDTLTPSLF